MPIFDMRCPDCGHETKNVLFMSGDTIPICPECKKMEKDVLMIKLVGAPAAIFKGSGFHSTDYKKKE